MANGRPMRGEGSLMRENNKFLLQRYDPGKGLVKKTHDYSFEGHIMSINDTSSPSWNQNFDAGRADPKVMYSQFSRNLDISFLVLAVNKDEHNRNYDMLSDLGKITYPIMRLGLGYNGPHVFYKIDELLAGFGVITSLSYVWDPTAHPWVDNKPLYTEVNISIMNLADINGRRPNANKSVYLFKPKYS